MMRQLHTRGEAIARAAQRKRIERIAQSLRAQGLDVETGIDSILIRGRRLLQKWLGDASVRFAGRTGQ